MSEFLILPLNMTFVQLKILKFLTNANRESAVLNDRNSIKWLLNILLASSVLLRKLKYILLMILEGFVHQQVQSNIDGWDRIQVIWDRKDIH